MCSATATSFLPRIGWLLLEEIIHLNFSAIHQASLSFHFQVHKAEIPSNQDPEQGFSRKTNSDLSDFIAGLFSRCCPFFAFPLLPLPPPRQPFSSSLAGLPHRLHLHTGCASWSSWSRWPMESAPHKSPGLVELCSATFSSQSPLVPVRGPICPVSTTGSSSLGSRPVIPLPPGPGATEKFLGAQWGHF